MRGATRAALFAIAMVGAPAFAQELEQQSPLFFDELPIHWIEPAHRALQDFSARHRDNLGCFSVLLHEAENGGFAVSFAAKLTITPTIAPDGEEGVLLSRPTTCGSGETFHYNAEGQLIRHNYMGH